MANGNTNGKGWKIGTLVSVAALCISAGGNVATYFSGNAALATEVSHLEEAVREHTANRLVHEGADAKRARIREEIRDHNEPIVERLTKLELAVRDLERAVKSRP
jgi:hypothetical protein